jgi:hypothetical protein
MPDADELYGLPFDEFIPARNALARELRNAGRREEAGEVAALRKPSVAAWAVNQLVRTQRRGVDELFGAGDALRAAHDQVLAGQGDAASLRGAVAGERAAVDALTATARGLLTSQGHELSATIIERVSDTLHAAALDDDARAQVRDGRLERELRHVGLGMTPGAAAARAPTRPRSAAAPKQDTKAERAERARAERERAQARAAARKRRDQAAQRLHRAERVLAEAERALEEAERALEEAERARGDAEAQLEQAEQAVRELG